jgi:hypothetical protein
MRCLLCRHLVDCHSRIHLESKLQLATSSFKRCDVSGKLGIPTLSLEELQSQFLLSERIESCRGGQGQELVCTALRLAKEYTDYSNILQCPYACRCKFGPFDPALAFHLASFESRPCLLPSIWGMSA